MTSPAAGPDDDGVVVLRTASSAYAVAPAPDGLGLVLLHWGRPDAVAGLAPPPPPRPTSWRAPADELALELAAAGTRVTGPSELRVQRPDGVDGARLRLRPGSVHLDAAEGDGAQHLTAVLEDPAGGVEVTQHWLASTRHDVVERWSEVRASGATALDLARAAGAGWNVPVGPGAVVTQLLGGWSAEFQPVDADLPAGRLSAGSGQGITSHTANPVLVLRARGAGSQGAYGVALASSGSWRAHVDAVPATEPGAGLVRVSVGPDEETTAVHLEPGESFRTPSTLGAWSPGGPDGLTRAWHRYQRLELLRPVHAVPLPGTPVDDAEQRDRHRPVVFDSWYCTGFDVTTDHQLALADAAAEVGADVLLVDDGWFRGRHDDTGGLGDWVPDSGKLPGGLGPLADGVLARGLRLGLWVEPEAVSPGTPVLCDHPDWAYRAGDRPATLLRHQLVLDLGRPAVEAWVAEQLRALLADGRVSYLKWDMNRPVSDGGRPGAPGGRGWSVQHAEAHLRLLDLLRREFPAVTVEACAGGGGRVDASVLARSDVVWASDETGPRDRLRVQRGFTRAYPARAMSSWVTDQADHRDTAPCSFEFRFVVAMAGVLGLGAAPLAWDAPRRRRPRELVQLHRRTRATVHDGALQHHGDDDDPVVATEHTTPDQVVLLVWARPGAGRGRGVRLRPQLVAPAGTYRLSGPGPGAGGTQHLTGAQLLRDGLEVPFALADDCDVVVLDRLA